jgi:hypothetical protein
LRKFFLLIEKLLAPDVDIEALSRRIPVNTYSQDWGKLGAVWGGGGLIYVGLKREFSFSHFPELIVSHFRKIILAKIAC